MNGDVIICINALAAVARSLELECAGIDNQQRVARQGGTGRSIQQALVGSLDACVTGGEGDEAAAIDGHHAAAAHTLGAITAGHHIDDTAVHDDAVVGTQAVERAALDIQTHTGTDADVVIATDAATPLGKDIETPLAAENHLSLAEEGRLLVLLPYHNIVAAVLQAVVRAVGQHNIHRLAALVVDGSTVGVGDIGTVEQYLEALVAVELQRPVGGMAADDEFHRT